MDGFFIGAFAVLLIISFLLYWLLNRARLFDLSKDDFLATILIAALMLTMIPQILSRTPSSTLFLVWLVFLAAAGGLIAIAVGKMSLYNRLIYASQALRPCLSRSFDSVADVCLQLHRDLSRALRIGKIGVRVDEVNITTEELHIVATLDPKESTLHLEEIVEQPLEELIISSCSMVDESLDGVPFEEHIARGFSFRESGHLTEAIAEFTSAADLRSGDSVVPYLYLEIGGMLKEMGAYEEAFTLLTRAKRLAEQHGHKRAAEEITLFAGYLRILINSFARNGLQTCSWADVSPTIKTVVEAEYREWLVQGRA